MKLSYAEENYLKALLKLTSPGEKSISTNAIAAHLSTAAASVTDMLKKLADKQLITYKRYQGASLTEEGMKMATSLIRKHRLWEVFLVESLQMTWDEVHEIAEELEHIQSEKLIERLDAFLGHPKFDPHGDPIPNSQGKYTLRSQLPMGDLLAGQSGVILGVRDDDSAFLKHLSEKGISIGKSITMISRDPYDHTIEIQLEKNHINLSGKVAQHVLVKLL